MNYRENIISSSLKRSIEKYKPNIQEALLDECIAESKQSIIVEKPERKSSLKPVFAVIAVCLLFIGIVNTVPAAALNLARIPVIDKLVWASVIDKGIFKSLEEGFSHQINEAVSDNDITFAVHDVILGNKIHFLLSLDFQFDTKDKKIESASISATDQNGKELSFMSTPLSYDESSGVYVFNCSVLPLAGNMIEDITSISLKITSITFDDGTQIKGNWQVIVSTPIESSTREATWEKEISITVTKDDGIPFILERVVSTPSDVAVYISINSEDARNAPRGIHIIDDKGNKIELNTVIGNKLGDMTQFKYYFEAVYPNIPAKIIYTDGDTIKEFDLMQSEASN